jgi:hypothetical protein
MNGTAFANRSIHCALSLRRSRIESFTRALLAIVLTSLTAIAASLHPASTKAWDEYISDTNAQTEQRVARRGTYLWVSEDPDRLKRVRAGETVIAPCGGHEGTRRVPGGLIHHWIGAIFIPDTRMQDVLQVVRNYPHYPDLYQPSVIAAKVISRHESKDRFSTVLVNHSVLLKSAFETTFASDYFHLDERHVYSKTWSTRIQEIEDYGSPSQRSLPEGEGSGIMWRLYSITRYAEADGGVYIEVEALGLTRDVPASLRWLIDPIIRRLSRSALTLSLRQTEKASQVVAQAAKRGRDARPSVAARGISSPAR